MDTWTLQTGYPELMVTRNYTTKEVQFKQHRFVYVDDSKKKKLLEQKTENPLWWIPLTYTTASKLDFNSTRPIKWIRKTPTLNLEIDIDDDDWFLVNIQQTGT